VTDDRGLRHTFDRAAEHYERARPSYPSALIDDLVHLTGIEAGDHPLEVGCGTGKATRQLAPRGFAITCIELGPALAGAATRQLSTYENVTVINADFDTWETGQRFTLVFAATSWHWLDPATRYRRAWQLLEPGGHLAFWSAGHVVPIDGDPFFAEIQEVYDEIGEGLPPGSELARPGAVPDSVAEVEASGLFEDVVTRQYDWEITYDAASYIDLLNTFSGHIAMAQWQRDRLYGQIRRRLAQRPDGLVRRHWGAVLHVARSGATSST
jgi:trans-aconitate methyltransferase